METDAEASGSNTELSSGTASARSPQFRNAATFANAMRRMEGEPDLKPGGNAPLLVIAAVFVVAVVVIIAAAVIR
jgi:hypothetical protein